MGDPLERMRVYQLAKELLEPSFEDAEVLRAHPMTAQESSNTLLAPPA